ncbi:MAG: methylmalonyl Co-A mutase-associated GTPase MeaB [Clostridia bacterium]|nr:methylmalonyl Co-A mutase-associated GTPase MeaB [Clostridia bacterium]
MAGERFALARAITWVESGDRAGAELMRLVYPHTGRAWVVGLTGAPGTGKSTLLAKLAARFAALGRSVGVVAVDPSSPVTGGALLGDRIRWTPPETGDVFFRSLASRGRLGGLSSAAFDAVRLMDAAGREVVIVETVGAGQGEVDVARLAHTTVVALAPGTGDEVQAAKAGIMEIGDLFVVTKADRPGADECVRDVRLQLGLSPEARGRREGFGRAQGPAGEEPTWFPPVVKVSARTGEGLDRLVRLLAEHRAYLEASGRFGRRAALDDVLRMEDEFRRLAFERARRAAERAGAWAEAVERLGRREIDPATAARLAWSGTEPFPQAGSAAGVEGADGRAEGPK